MSYQKSREWTKLHDYGIDGKSDGCFQIRTEAGYTGKCLRKTRYKRMIVWREIVIGVDGILLLVYVEVTNNRAACIRV